MRQRIVSICGAHSSCGKTTIAENILRLLGPSWGAIKYTKTAFYTSVKELSSDESLSGKDTGRFLKAGAGKVVWIQAPHHDLAESVSIATGMLSDCKGIIAEGNSLIEFLEPDVVIFVFGRDTLRLKPSARGALKKAGIIICQNNSTDPELSDLLNEEGNADIISMDIRNGNEYERLMEVIMKKMGEPDGTGSAVENPRLDALKKAINEEAISGRLPCSAARAIAEKSGVPYIEIGRLADELEIRIIDCELGCF